MHPVFAKNVPCAVFDIYLNRLNKKYVKRKFVAKYKSQIDLLFLICVINYEL